MRKISIKNKFMRKIFAAGIFSLMASTGLTSGANAAVCSISGTTSFGYTGAAETCDVTQAGTYGITAIGGDSGSTSQVITHGAEISGDIQLASGEALTIIVGGEGVEDFGSQNGGGGSFVFQGTGTSATPLVVGGGSGGNGDSSYGENASLTSSGGSSQTTVSGGTNGGNGGTSGNGSSGYGYITVLSNPAIGPTFGGGGAGSNLSGGGGGGYSGGGGGTYEAGGGGGGSYVTSSATNTSSLIYYGSTYSGYGEVLFNYVGPPTSSSGSGTTGSGTTPTSVPEPSSLAILMAALVGLGGAVFYKRKNG